MATFRFNNDRELSTHEPYEVIRSIFMRIFWSKASGGLGRLYVCCVSCDGEDGKCVMTKKDIRPKEEKAEQQTILLPTVCRGCELEWQNGGGFLANRDKAAQLGA